jgi:hypothetical protein
MPVSAALDFIAGFFGALMIHVARIILWAALVCVAAVILKLEPSWQLLGVVVAGNALGRLVYPDGEDVHGL